MPGIIHHVSITCTDIAASQSFYQLLGFIPSKIYEDNQCIIVLLKGKNSCVELFNFKLVAIGKFEAKKLESIGLTHIGIETDDLAITNGILTNAGYQCNEYQEARMGGFRYFFTSDPDGNLVEIIEEK